jgi:hypothetical protein
MHGNQTTWPEYHLKTFATWLPEDDWCKPVLERDLFAHLSSLEIQQDLEYDPGSWWWDTYAPCAYLYFASFTLEYKMTVNDTADGRFDGDLYYYTKPETFRTAKMSSERTRNAFALISRLLLQPHKRLPTSSEDSFLYTGMTYIQGVRAFFINRRVNAEQVAVEENEAAQLLFKPVDHLHTIGEYSIYADKLDKNNRPIPGSSFSDIVRPVHKKMAEFPWQKAFGQAARNWRNETFRQELRDNPTGVSMRSIANVMGGLPRIDTSTHYKPWRHVSAGMLGRRLLQLVPRDFNFNEIIRSIGSLIADIFVFIFQVLAVLVRALNLETAADLIDMLVERIVTFDYNTLLNDLYDFVLTYITDTIESLDCSAPEWYDARDAPLAPWKCQCLLQLKLPPNLPRWPDLTQMVIPWGSPCTTDVGVCGWDGSFPGIDFPGNIFDDVPIPIVNQLPCEAGYRECKELGFTDGFDILIYFIELVSIETGIDLIGILRSDELGTIVGIGLNIAAIILYPIGILFGFTNTLNDLIGITSLRDLPYVGPVVFRFADFAEFPTGDFYNFCLGWGFALATLPLIISVLLFISFGYYLVETPALVLGYLNLFFRAFVLPFTGFVFADTERFKERWDDPVWVYVQDSDMYDNELGAIDYTPRGGPGSEVEVAQVARPVVAGVFGGPSTLRHRA